MPGHVKHLHTRAHIVALKQTYYTYSHILTMPSLHACITNQHILCFFWLVVLASDDRMATFIDYLRKSQILYPVSMLNSHISHLLCPCLSSPPPLPGRASRQHSPGSGPRCQHHTAAPQPLVQRHWRGGARGTD